MCYMHSLWIYVSVSVLTFALNTDVLWQSCNTVICGARQLNIQCESSSYVLINNVSSGLDREFDQRSYNNLRRLCLGLVICEPSRAGFCQTHSNVEFTVNYICVRDQDVEKDCDPNGKAVSSNIGFITSPNYPAESRYKTCSWKIRVPPRHFAHVFLHEVLPISSTEEFCHGLHFTAKSTCGEYFPSSSICDESKVDAIITSCSDIDVTMSAKSIHSMRFWLSYYVVPVSDLQDVIIFDTDLTCDAIKKDVLVFRPKLPLLTSSEASDRTTPLNLTREVNSSPRFDEDNTVVYIGVAAAVLTVIIIIVVVAIFYVRHRRSYKPNAEVSPSTSNSNNSHKGSLADRQLIAENTTDPVLGDGYSRVADAISPSDKATNKTYSTYSEIDDSNKEGLKPQTKVINRRSIGCSERKLPETPKEEPYNARCSKMDDQNVPYIAKITEKNYKQISPSRSRFNEIKAKYEREQEKKTDNKYSGYSGAKKMSNASNIYADISDDINEDEKRDTDKAYIEMEPKTKHGADKLKGIKEKFNFARKTLGGSKAESTAAKHEGAQRENLSWQKDSVTSAESDSDDDLCIVENELYEPFESAKV